MTDVFNFLESVQPC